MIRTHIKVPQITDTIYKEHEKCQQMAVQIANFQKSANQIMTSTNTTFEDEYEVLYEMYFKVSNYRIKIMLKAIFLVQE